MTTNPNTQAREFALQFLYQCEAEKLYYFSDSHFRSFTSHFEIPAHIEVMTRSFAEHTLERVSEIDERIQAAATNWKVQRMPVVDRNILRLAVYELLETTTPYKVVLNEAIEMAKKYGSEDSGKFVNGILDRIGKTTEGAIRGP